MLEIKNIVIEMNYFDALIRGLDRIKKRISEFEDRPSSNRNAKRKNDFFNETEYEETVEQLQKAKQM